MIEIVFSGSAYGGLATASSSHPENIERMKVEAREFGNNVPIKPIEEPELILPFEFQWDIGHLDQPEDSEYRMKIPARLYYGHHVRLHPEDEPELLKDGEKNIKALKGLRILAEQGREIRIWYSNSSMELCGYYYLCHVLRDYDVVIHAVELPAMYAIGNKPKQITNWGMAHGYEYGYLIENERTLTKEEICYVASLWDKLVEENAPLRAVISNRLVSVPEDFYDSLFLRCFEGDTMAENVWTSDIMSLGLGISCGFVEQRIWSMGEIGIIQLLQDGENMSERIWKR